MVAAARAAEKTADKTKDSAARNADHASHAGHRRECLRDHRCRAVAGHGTRQRTTQRATRLEPARESTDGSAADAEHGVHVTGNAGSGGSRTRSRLRGDLSVGVHDAIRYACLEATRIAVQRRLRLLHILRHGVVAVAAVAGLRQRASGEPHRSGIGEGAEPVHRLAEFVEEYAVLHALVGKELLDRKRRAGRFFRP